jgi:homoserine O-acetyltransferase/O-succinyltransferase
MVKDFHFNSGEVLPQLRLPLVTLGTPRRNSSGGIDNAALLLHSTGGDTSEFLDQAFSGPLYGPGQPDRARMSLPLRKTVLQEYS